MSCPAFVVAPDSILATVPLSTTTAAAASLAATEAAVEPVASSRLEPVLAMDAMRSLLLCLPSVASLLLTLLSKDDRLPLTWPLALSPCVAASWSAEMSLPFSSFFIKGLAEAPALPSLLVLL